MLLPPILQDYWDYLLPFIVHISQRKLIESSLHVMTTKTFPFVLLFIGFIFCNKHDNVKLNVTIRYLKKKLEHTTIFVNKAPTAL